MTAPDGFLSRWSRRKLDARETRHDPPLEPTRELPASSQPPADDVPAPSPEAAADTRLPVEEIARLPRIDELTAETDLAPFLRSGVPDALRRAALRRMWAVDPAVRDYVGDALDYAFDWNTPGGVPGSGPLLPTDDVQAILTRMFGDSPSEDAPPPDEEREGAQIAPAEAEPARLAEPASADGELEDRAIPDGSGPADLSGPADVAPPPVRRHGRAVPT